MNPILQSVAHRPWPLPRGPWVMSQTWNNLLFAHLPVPVAQLRSLVPTLLHIDTFNGEAWVAVTPFSIGNLRARFLPPLPPFSSFPELNVRTYVKVEDKPGVFFFSLDAASLAAVMGARALYFLPYFHARMRIRVGADEVRYWSRRLRGREARFEARYAPVSPPRNPERGTLEHWLVERYCLYTVMGGALYRAEIHHLPWPLHDARAHIVENTMAQAAGIDLPDTDPLVHFAQRLRVFVWPLHRVAASVPVFQPKPAAGQVVVKPV
jgi:uncharacterized protein YqjF (DUF2071 family)